MCRQVRLVSDCYVIVVSARTAEVDRLIGLEVGADDYLVKPFSMRELQARVAALFRRPRIRRPPPSRREPGRRVAAAGRGRPRTVDDGPARLRRPDPQPGAREVRVYGEEVDLTRTEFDLLAHLVSNPGVVVPREDLLRAVWAPTSSPTAPTSSTSTWPTCGASCARRRRTTQWIRTIRGVGFRFDPCCT